MFSLIITIISIALVAALALATLYYGGSAFTQGRAAAQAATLRAQGQQLLGASELFYAQRNDWPDTVEQLVLEGYLKSVPVAQGPIAPAWADTAWDMPAQGVPVFVMNSVDVEACRKVNEGTYGLPGVLPELRQGYASQCYGTSTSGLKMVVSRGTSEMTRAALEGDGTIAPEDISSAPVPAASTVADWFVPPYEDAPVEPAVPEAPAALSADPATLTFVAQATNTTETLVVTVQNTGGASASFGGAPAVSGHLAYSVAETTCGAVVAGGSSCTVSVSYAPTSVGTGQDGTLTLTPANGAALTVALTGSAFNPVSLSGATLPDALRNQAYGPVSFADYLVVSNETTPDLGQVAWEAQGALPAGLSFDAVSGTLAGTPTTMTAEEGQSFTVLATYKNNQGQQVYVLRVGATVLNVVQIAAGGEHTCAVTTAGGVKCWGTGGGGRLGDGLNTTSTAPVDVFGLTSGVIKISAGSGHTCAVTTAGGVKCWGSGASGQLGDGLSTTSGTPVAVSGLTGVTSISAGSSHTCAVTAGGAKCWGNNNNGLLGDGSITARSTPVDVSGLTTGVGSISAGSAHTCAVTTAGGAKCWGSGSYGRLGDGATSTRYTPVDVTDLTTGVASISAAGTYTCAVTTAGGAKCWGQNTNGQLGDGSTTTRTTPVNVSSLSAVSISTGSSHACAVTTAGGVKCWGSNSLGQLGTGNTTNSRTPVDVAGLTSGVGSISVNWSDSCALVTSGGAKCWGTNNNGILGDGTTTTRLSPVSVLE